MRKRFHMHDSRHQSCISPHPHTAGTCKPALHHLREDYHLKCTQDISAVQRDIHIQPAPMAIHMQMLSLAHFHAKHPSFPRCTRALRDPLPKHIKCAALRVIWDHSRERPYNPSYIYS
jgi:hypothetical protein